MRSEVQYEEYCEEKKDNKNIAVLQLIKKLTEIVKRSYTEYDAMADKERGMWEKCNCYIEMEVFYAEVKKELGNDEFRVFGSKLSKELASRIEFAEDYEVKKALRGYCFPVWKVVAALAEELT